MRESRTCEWMNEGMTAGRLSLCERASNETNNDISYKSANMNIAVDVRFMLGDAGQLFRYPQRAWYSCPAIIHVRVRA